MFKAKSCLLILIAVFLGWLVFPENVIAATMSVTPSSGSYGEAFTLELVINGEEGEKFNAAEAQVSLSPNLFIDDLTLGDCQFSFLTTPTMDDPSFQGVLLSESKTQCSVYTLKLVPLTIGTASVSIIDGKVKRFGDAAEILTEQQGGNFELTGSVTPSREQVPVNKSESGLYVVRLKVIDLADQPVMGAAIDLMTPSGEVSLSTTTNEEGIGEMKEVTGGIYEVSVKKDNQPVIQHILNVSGSNELVSLTLKEQLSAEENIDQINFLFHSQSLILGSIAIGLLARGLLVFLKGKKKSQ